MTPWTKWSVLVVVSPFSLAASQAAEFEASAEITLPADAECDAEDSECAFSALQRRSDRTVSRASQRPRERIGVRGVLQQPGTPESNVTDLPGGKTLKEYLEGMPGVEEATIVHDRSDLAYRRAFLMNTIVDKLPYGWGEMFGDLGASFHQPGFGGLKTFNVVNFTVSKDFMIYHMNNEDYTCSIWWSMFESDDTTRLNASINAQTSSTYTGVTHCDMHRTFTAIVGQGWPVDLDGCEERKDCGCEARGDCGKKPRIVAKQLEKLGFPNATVGQLQVVIPACRREWSKKCMSCPMDVNNVTFVPKGSGKCKEAIDGH